MSAIKMVAKDMQLSNGTRVPRVIVEWALTTGLVGVTGITAAEYADPNAALGYIASFDEKGNETPTIFVLKDLHRIMENDLQVIRFLRDISVRFETRKHNLILLSPVMRVPTDIEKQMALIDWPLPDVSELEAIMRQAEMDLPTGTPVTLNGSRDSVIQALRGLTDSEAANVLKAGVVATGELGDGVLPHILNEKKQIIRKSGILEYFEATITMSDVGGLDNLKKYAAENRTAMSAEARAAGVDSPKGVLLVGPAGTGKSLSAKAIAGGVYPLLRLDVGKLLGGGRVGEAEGNITSALKVAEAVSPCVMWLDEIEKALADNGGASDGGVMQRVLGSLLTWMQETTAPVYVVATANNISALRPELLSRFDDVCYVDLPDNISRLEILKVHLTKRGVKMPKSLSEIVDATWGFSGREIERVVKFAIKRAFFEKKTLTVSHLIEAAKGIIPTSVTKADEIQALRTWAKDKAIPAGRPLESKSVSAQANKQVEM
jgi:AAA+ superfamily predicted ATPase